MNTGDVIKCSKQLQSFLETGLLISYFQREFNSVDKWARQWKIKLYSLGTVHISFALHNRDPINDVPIQQKTGELRKNLEELDDEKEGFKRADRQKARRHKEPEEPKMTRKSPREPEVIRKYTEEPIFIEEIVGGATEQGKTQMVHSRTPL